MSDTLDFSRRAFIAAPAALARAQNAGSGSGHKTELPGAKWIWLPSQRTLPNTFVLFRKTVQLADVPRRAVLSIAADSR